MKKIFITTLFLIPLICLAQTDVLILQKDGRNLKTFAPGMYLMMHTIYDQWLEGNITDMRNDSVFINDIPFHVREIDALRDNFSKLNLMTGGTIFIIAGVGVLALNVINGLYTNEPAGQWVKLSGWITAGVFIVAGVLMKRAKYKNYPIGKKYTLHYLNLRAKESPAENGPSLKPGQPVTTPDAH
jgi:hypothetical protein